MKKTMLGVLLAAAAQCAWSADTDGRYIAAGPTCGQYATVTGTAKYQWGWWMHGYFAAYNSVVPDTTSILGGSDLASAMLWMDNWCKANPLKSVVSGMEELIAELRPSRYRSMKETGR